MNVTQSPYGIFRQPDATLEERAEKLRFYFRDTRTGEKCEGTVTIDESLRLIGVPDEFTHFHLLPEYVQDVLRASYEAAIDSGWYIPNETT
ncbi:MAG: hypothetical protein ACMXYM_00775 [Candidatus Woesearchaeota archaeon]